MDLPTCPACGQSVLDDEAEECPFCGASMSGKPQARKQAAPAAAPKSPKPAGSTRGEQAGAAKAGAGGSKASPAGAKAEVADDDPFAVESAAKQNAVPLRPEPAKGRTHKVVCPMCETPGYTSIKAAGRDVRCCNPDCLVPVFTAPEVKREKPAPAPAKKSPSKAVVAGAAGLLLVLIAGSVWYFGFREVEDPNAGGTAYVPQRGGGENPGLEVQPPGDDSASPLTRRKSKTDDPTTPQTIRAAALAKMREASEQRERNPSKPYCRRLTAAALAHIGDVKGAREQLAQMQNLQPRVPYFQIEPLVEIAWRELEAGNSEAVKQALDEALKEAQQLPTRGRTRLQFAVELAAALAAADRLPDAQALIGRHEERSAEGVLAAELSAMRAMNQYNASAFAAEAPIYRWAAPQTVAVVVVLSEKGYAESARQWAAGAQAVDVRSEATLVWADVLLRQALAEGKQPDMAAIEAAAAALPPAGRGRLYARLAGRHAAAESKAEAEALLAKAHAELANVAPPAELVLPDMKGLTELRLPPAAPLRMQALAASEIALAEGRAGNADKAIAACELAMQFLRGSAPSPLAIGRRINEFTDLPVREMRDKLKAALDLKTDDMARLAYNDYRRKCDEIAEAAAERFGMQESILTAAAEAGLADFVWQEIKSRAEHSDRELREPWAKTGVPWVLVDRYEQQGDADAAKPIRALSSAAGARRAPIDQIVRAAEASIDGGRFKQAAREFEGREAMLVSQQERDERRLRIAGRLIAQRKLDGAFEFLGAIADLDASLREEALWFAAAQATQSGEARKVWEIGQRPTWSATEVVSIYGGLIQALEVPAAATTASAADSAESSAGS